MLADVVPLVGLVALLLVAFAHTAWWVELGVSVAAVLACVATSASSWPQAADAAGQMLPVVVFLVAILAVAGACAELGLFRAVGERIGRPGTSPVGFLGLTFVAAVAVTAVLSLDATVVLLTLVVLAAAGSAGVSSRPGLSACVRLANTSSLLLPVSNLTNLLAAHRIDLSFGRFALAMTPAWLGVIAVEYVVHRLAFRRELAETPLDTAPSLTPTPLPRFPLAVVAAMLVGFALTSVAGIGAAWGAAWVSVVAALVLLVPAARAGRGVSVGRATQPAFAVFVLGLAVVVDAVGHGPLGDLVSRALPSGHPGLLVLLWLAVLATLLANVLNNLPATLLVVPLVAPLGTVAILATLIGLNVGSSLTWTGSLANLLWRRTLHSAGDSPSSRSFHAVSVVAAPLGVVVGVLLVWAWAPLALPGG